MWIMTPFGILMPASIPPETRAEIVADWNQRPRSRNNPNWDIQVRVRDQRALTFLRKNYMGKLLGPTIATPEMDYDFRAYCTKRDFADAVRLMIAEIDYTKFKPEARSDELHDLYTRIWGVVYNHYAPVAIKRKLRKRRWYDEDDRHPLDVKYDNSDPN